MSNTPIQSPINPDFIEYLKKKNQKIISNEFPLGYVPPTTLLPASDLTLSSKALYPEKFDLRDFNKVTPVKNQGSLGSCWAHAACASMESNLLTGETTDFSENNMINRHGFSLGPNDGGNDEMASAYLMRYDGPMDEADDPYTGDIHPSPPNISPIKHAQDIIFIPQRESYTDNNYIKSLLMNHGAVTSSFFWDPQFYNSVTHSFYCNNNGITATNHGVTIIGWDDSYDKNNFLTPPPANGAFIIKNSWGTTWGDNGYFYMSYYDVTFRANALYLPLQSPINYNSIYYHDEFGFIGYLYYVNEKQVVFSNMFEAKENSYLTAISLFSVISYTEYELSIYTNCVEFPDDGQIMLTQTFTADFAGYSTIKLNTPVEIKSGELFSILLNGKSPTDSTFLIPVEFKIDGYSDAATINPKESFCRPLSTPDWFDLFDDNSKLCNISIKAYTNNAAVAYFNPKEQKIDIPSNEVNTTIIPINVEIKNLPYNQSVLGFHNLISFNSSILEVVDCTVPSNSYLSKFIGEPIIDIDNTVGTVEVNLGRSPTDYPGENGIVYTVNFKAKTSGYSEFNHVSAELRDNNGDPIPLSTETGVIEVIIHNTLCGDFNNDGKIDFEDLMLLAKAWNKKSTDTGWGEKLPDMYSTPYCTKDIGPAIGVAPDFIPTLDNIVNSNDYDIFVQMWNWIRSNITVD